MDPEKVNAILNWKAPKSVTEIQCFLSFAIFTVVLSIDARTSVSPCSTYCVRTYRSCGIRLVNKSLKP